MFTFLATALYGGQSSQSIDKDVKLNVGRSSMKEEDRKRKKGLKKFIIEGEEYWAINKKNAYKKSRQ